MTKKEELRERTVKYFVEQKIYEVGGFIIGSGLFMMMTYLLGTNSRVREILGSGDESWIATGIVATLSIIFIHLVIFFILYGAYILLISWIESNWEKAEERAKEEIK